MAALCDFLTLVNSLIILIVFLSFHGISHVEGLTISDKRLCADKNCETVISKVKALASYPSEHPQLLTFKQNDIIIVKSKAAGTNQRLWGGEINGQRGYFDRYFVKEIQVIVAQPQHVVATEGDQFAHVKEKPSAQTEEVKEKPSAQTEEVKEKPSAQTEEVKEKPSPQTEEVKETQGDIKGTTDAVEKAANQEQQAAKEPEPVEDKPKEPNVDQTHDNSKPESDGNQEEDQEGDEDEEEDDEEEEEPEDDSLAEWWEELDTYAEPEKERSLDASEDEDSIDEPWEELDEYADPGRELDAAELNKYIKSRLTGDEKVDGDAQAETAPSGPNADAPIKDEQEPIAREGTPSNDGASSEPQRDQGILADDQQKPEKSTSPEVKSVSSDDTKKPGDNQDEAQGQQGTGSVLPEQESEGDTEKPSEHQEGTQGKEGNGPAVSEQEPASNTEKPDESQEEMKEKEASQPTPSEQELAGDAEKPAGKQEDTQKKEGSEPTASEQEPAGNTEKPDERQEDTQEREGSKPALSEQEYAVETIPSAQEEHDESAQRQAKEPEEGHPSNEEMPMLDPRSDMPSMDPDKEEEPVLEKTAAYTAQIPTENIKGNEDDMEIPAGSHSPVTDSVNGGERLAGNKESDERALPVSDKKQGSEEPVYEADGDSLGIKDSEETETGEKRDGTAPPQENQALSVEPESKETPTGTEVPNVEKMEQSEKVEEKKVDEETSGKPSLESDIKPDTESGPGINERVDSGPPSSGQDPAQNEEVPTQAEDTEKTPEGLAVDQRVEPPTASQDRSAEKSTSSGDQLDFKPELELPQPPETPKTESEMQEKTSAPVDSTTDQGRQDEQGEGILAIPDQVSGEEQAGTEDKPETAEPGNMQHVDQKEENPQAPADAGLSDLLHGSETKANDAKPEVAASPTVSIGEAASETSEIQGEKLPETLRPSSSESLPQETSDVASDKEEGFETIVQEGTTIVLDAGGNIMTIIDEAHTSSTVVADSQTETPVSFTQKEASQTEEAAAAAAATPQLQASPSQVDDGVKATERSDKIRNTVQTSENTPLQASESEVDSKAVSAGQTPEAKAPEEASLATPQLDASKTQAEVVTTVAGGPAPVVSPSSMVMPTATDSAHTAASAVPAAEAPPVSNILLHSSVVEALPSTYSSNSTANLDAVGSADSPVRVDDIDLRKDLNPSHEAYESVDFNSRKVLSVSSSQQQQKPQQRQEEAAGTGSDGEVKEQDVKPTEVTRDMYSSTPGVETAALPAGDSGMAGASGQDDSKVSSSTESPTDSGEIPPPPTEREDPEGAAPAAAGGDYQSEPVHQTRKINDEDLYSKETEEIARANPGFAKSVLLSLEELAKGVIEKLPPSVQSMLEQEPLGLSPTMTVLSSSAMLATLVMITMTSCFCSGGSKEKKQLKASVGVIRELESKLLLATKERENIEDMVHDNKSESKHLKEEMTKHTKEAAKLQTELQTVKLHNETLKNQVLTLQEELDEVRNNANTSQGEVKQQNKKTKDLEKQIKKLDESRAQWEQESHKLAADLKFKDEELENLSSQVSGFVEQIGHLQTSKDQLLQEAEDWKEKLTNSNERLEQRDEEFKQMQESLLFKENELEVLKDCFLQLKSFEDNGTTEEDLDSTNVQVQEKLQAMMDVSKVNGSLRVLEEEKSSLENKLSIERDGRKVLEEQLASTQRSMETSMADKMKAERQCQEAQTKLNVLSSYFKEKEMQLQRELGEQEALKKQNQSKLMSADETTQSMQQELELARAQSESLKRELSSSERDFRTQIAANEKKAHENWLAARAAERELKESRHEAGVLRQKLTDIERRQFIGPGGLIRPLPTRGMPPPGMINGPPPPPGMDRPPSRGSLPHMRDEEFLASPRSDRGSDRGAPPPPPPFDPRRGPGPLPPGMRPPPPHGARPPPPDARSPPPQFDDSRSPPPRMPPPGMLDGRSPPPMPPFDRRPPPHHMMDRRSPPFRLPPPDMLPPSHPMRAGPMPPPHLLGRGGSMSPPSGQDSPHLDSRPDGRYPPYARHPPPPSDRPSPRQSSQPSPRQQQSQV